MKKIKIISDTSCDIPQGYDELYNITLLPLHVIVGDKSYEERFEINLDDFYGQLSALDRIPTTAQVTPYAFEDAYKDAYKQGYTDVIVVSINSLGSQTFTNSVAAKETVYNTVDGLKEKMTIHNVDSKTYSIAYGYAVIEAAKKVRAGESVEDIIAFLEDWFVNLEIFLIPYNLKYAKKSGRISAAAAFLGELMGLRPLIAMIDGTTKVIEKVRGDKNVLPKMVQTVCDRIEKGTPYCIIRAALDDPPNEFAKELTKKLGYPPAYVNKVGCAVVVNCGPDIIAVTFRRAEGKEKLI